MGSHDRILLYILNWGTRRGDVTAELLIGIAGGIVAVVGTGIAIWQAVEAKNAKREIKELRGATTSYKFLREKAMELYESGKHEESLDTFRKYYLDHKDEQEAWDTVNEVMRAETARVFSLSIIVQGMTSSPVLLLHALDRTARTLTKKLQSGSERDAGLPKYSDLARELVALHERTFREPKPVASLVISLTNGNYEYAKQLLPSVVLFDDPELNTLFVAFLNRYCDTKLPEPQPDRLELFPEIKDEDETPDKSEEDIPF
jgi:hypothetical protein